MYLTLPIPVTKKWKHVVEYIPWDLSRPHVKVEFVVANLNQEANDNHAGPC